MLRRYFTASLLIFLFIFTQQSGFAHEISHVHDPVSHSQKQDKTHLNFCEKCANYNHLDNGITVTFHYATSTQSNSSNDHFIAKKSPVHFGRTYLAQAPPKNA